VSVRYAPGWYLTAASLALFLLVTAGFDVSEGIEHAAWARAMAHTGQIGLTDPISPNWVRGRDGRFYSAHEIGNAIALVPTVWLAERLRAVVSARRGETMGASIEGALVPMAAAVYVALTLMAFYRLSIDALQVSLTTALVAAAALGTTSILLPYSRMLFDGVLGGMLAAWALVWGHDAARKRDAVAALLSGVAVGAAIATRQTLAVFLIPVLAMLLFHSARSAPVLAAFAAGLTPALLWQAWYNTVRTGAFYLPAASLPQFQNLTADGSLVEGISGLLVSPGKSVFLYSPLLVLSLAGAAALLRRCRPLAIGLLVAFAAYTLVHASIRNWAGEWGWGPRYLVPLTLPLALPAVLVIERARQTGSRARRGAVVAVVSAGLAVQALAIATNWHYCYSWLEQQGRFDLRRLAWSMGGNQLVETARMFGDNLVRLAGGQAAFRVVHGAAPATQAASNSVNVWPLTALREGVPASLLALTCAALVVLCVVTARAAFAKAQAVDLRPE
jgi:hypothetical protein